MIFFKPSMTLNRSGTIDQRAQWNTHRPFFFLLLLVMVGYLLIHDLAGGTLFLHEPLDSYTLQALAWRRGEAYLADGASFPWLELAIYQGKYFVSFPPVPSLFVLPLTFLFGVNTPNTLLVAVYAMLALTGAYRACLACKMRPLYACFWALFAVYASNIAEISTNGGVWLQAQTLNYACLMWAVDCAVRDRRARCALCLVLAVGCRPFSALYIPVAVIYFFFVDWQRDSAFHGWRT